MGDERAGLMELDRCMGGLQMLQPQRGTEKELAFSSSWLPTITACQLSCRVVFYFLPLYRNIFQFQGLLILSTIKYLNEIYAPICFQPKNRYSISICNCKLFLFLKTLFLLTGNNLPCVHLKFYPSVFHISYLSLQNL